MSKSMEAHEPRKWLIHQPLLSHRFDNSGVCGTCLAVRGGCVGGSGGTPISTAEWKFVLVTDVCSSQYCGSGDLVLGQNGDGRWDIKWCAL